MNHDSLNPDCSRFTRVKTHRFGFLSATITARVNLDTDRSPIAVKIDADAGCGGPERCPVMIMTGQFTSPAGRTQIGVELQFLGIRHRSSHLRVYRIAAFPERIDESLHVFNRRSDWPGG